MSEKELKNMYDLGCECIKNKEYDMAFTVFERLSQLEDYDAICNLGLCYENGLGTDKNIEKAIYYYQKASDANNARAQFFLGKCIGMGTGIEKNPKQAFELFEKSANQGYIHAINAFGECYENGFGVEVDYDKAVSLYKKLVQEKKDPRAQCNLGVCYMLGRGVIESEKLAAICFQMSAESGCKEALFMLSECYKQGRGVEVDPIKAGFFAMEHFYAKEDVTKYFSDYFL